MAVKETFSAESGGGVTRVSARGYMLIILTGAAVLNAADRQILAILAEPIKNEMGISDSQIGLLSGLSFAIFYSVFGIPLAMWGDRGNRRNLVALSVGAFSLMTACCGLAMNYAQLLMARVGVGVGEAGSNSPSHSMIADSYPRSERPGALGVWGMSHAAGKLLGFAVGGWVAQVWGWRVAFIVLGVPGVLLAMLTRLTIAEPKRGTFEAVNPAKPPPLLDALQLFWRIRSLRWVVIGQCLLAFSGYSITFWTGSHLARTFGLNLAVIGTSMALVMGLGGMVGTYAVARVAQSFAKRDTRWLMRVPAMVIATTGPSAAAFFMAPTPLTALLLSILPAATINCAHGPILTVVQSTVPANTRVLASSIMTFCGTMVGLGLGPIAIGLFSDVLRTTTGRESLSYVLTAACSVMLLAAMSFWFASSSLGADLEAQEGRD